MNPTIDQAEGDHTLRYGAVFWASATIGLFLIGLGVRGILGDRGATPPRGFAQWFIGSAIVHDALIAPCAFAIAWAVGRVLPRVAVVPVRLGLATSALLIAFAWPLIRGYGRRKSNPSALPLDYGRNFALALVVVWLTVLSAIATKTMRAHRARFDEQRLAPRR